MFIFDEAQHLKETGRGFTLESMIALLDYLSRETDHEIVLISAAMGNAGAIAQWLSPDGQAPAARVPVARPAAAARRLHHQGALGSDAVWNRSRGRRIWPYRLITPLSGADPAADGRRPHRTADRNRDRLATGPQVQDRATNAIRAGHRRGRTTKRYVIASEMITELGHAGSVLVVASTRNQAQQLAHGLAAELSRASRPSAARRLRQAPARRRASTGNRSAARRRLPPRWTAHRGSGGPRTSRPR